MNESHRVLRERLGGYALGQLDDVERGEVHAHLADCAPCRAEYDDIAPVARLLDRARSSAGAGADWPYRSAGDPVASVTTAPPMSAALLAEISGGRARPDRAGGPSLPRIEQPAAHLPAAHSDELAARRARRRSGPGRLLAAAAAGLVLLGGVGTGGYLLGTGPRVPTEDVAVRAMAPQIQATAALVPHTWGMEVKLNATGFVTGASYAVTVVDDQGRTVSAGEFIGTGENPMKCNLNSSILRGDAAQVLVTDAEGALVLDATV